MDMKTFFKESTIPVANVKFKASKRFTDENGEPVEWELRPLTCDEMDAVMLKDKNKIIGKKGKIEADVDKSMNRQYEIAVKSIVSPNLRLVELQDSWGTTGEIQTLKAMLLPGEVQKMADYILEISGFDDDDLNATIETSKN